MKAAIINGGMRSINAIVDITNYVMLSVGQPTHAFDRTHVKGEKIIIRDAKTDEKLELLDGANIDLTEQDLVICDAEGPMALAGIRGGKKDSILDDTVDVVLEVANFAAVTIRNTGKRGAHRSRRSRKGRLRRFLWPMATPWSTTTPFKRPLWLVGQSGNPHQRREASKLPYPSVHLA